jgi:hypothetical protein
MGKLIHSLKKKNGGHKDGQFFENNAVARLSTRGIIVFTTGAFFSRIFDPFLSI